MSFHCVRAAGFAAALLVLACLGSGPGQGAADPRPAAPAGDWVAGNDCYSEPVGTDLDTFTYVPPSPGLRKAAKTATFKVTYAEEVPEEARKAFKQATDIWAAVIESSVPIEVEVKWAEIVSDAKGEPDKGLVMGRSYPTGFRRDFTGAPRTNVWYPYALANKFAKRDLDPDKSDIIVIFNSKAPWYFGTDGATPRGKYDFLTIALHELGHGLGLATSLKGEGKEASWGIKDKEGKKTSPTVFDTFVRNQAGKQLIDTEEFPNPSAELYAEVTGRKLFFAGRLATAANGGSPPPLHAPLAYRRGSSVVHLAENIFPPGHLNSLLTPSNFRAEAIHHPGPVLLGMIRDLGW